MVFRISREHMKVKLYFGTKKLHSYSHAGPTILQNRHGDWTVVQPESFKKATSLTFDASSPEDIHMNLTFYNRHLMQKKDEIHFNAITPLTEILPLARGRCGRKNVTFTARQNGVHLKMSAVAEIQVKRDLEIKFSSFAPVNLGSETNTSAAHTLKTLVEVGALNKGRTLLECETVWMANHK